RCSPQFAAAGCLARLALGIRRHCPSRSTAVAQIAASRPRCRPRRAAQIRFSRRLSVGRLKRFVEMSDAALQSAADQSDEDALREAIRHRVEAAGTSFYWAMRFLPRDRRYGMYAIYAFCREVDDIADGDRPVEYKLVQLARWHDEIEALYDGQPRHLLARALSRPVRCYALRKEDFFALLAGMEMDARADIRAPDLATLDLYCSR